MSFSRPIHPDIHHFVLLKELPGSPVGSIVQINDADGRFSLSLRGIELEPYLVSQHPDFFKAVTKEEHLAICEENSILYMMEKGRTREEAIKLLKTL